MKSQPPDDELVQKQNNDVIITEKNRASCRHCTDEIVQEFVKGIWIHGDYNRYNCTLAEPLSKKQSLKFRDAYRPLCKLHNYQPSKYSDTMICTKCFDDIPKKDFFTNRNIYWCRIHNEKFTNIDYHKKKKHTQITGGKTYVTVMDYIEYDSEYEEIPIEYEDKKRRWATRGHGCSETANFGRDRYNFHIINYGFISKAKFIKLVSKIINEVSTSWLQDRTSAAGNDIKYISNKDKDLILFIDTNKKDIAIKYDTDGNLVWINPKFGKKFKKQVGENYS